MVHERSIKKYGWYSPKQKKIDQIVKSTNNSIYWETPDNSIIEVTIVNTDKNDSGTSLNDIKLIGEVVKYFGSFES